MLLLILLKTPNLSQISDHMPRHCRDRAGLPSPLCLSSPSVPWVSSWALLVLVVTWEALSLRWQFQQLSNSVPFHSIIQSEMSHKHMILSTDPFTWENWFCINYQVFLSQFADYVCNCCRPFSSPQHLCLTPRPSSGWAS